MSVFLMLKSSFLNQSLCCDHLLDSSRRDESNKGHNIGIGWEIEEMLKDMFYLCLLSGALNQYNIYYAEFNQHHESECCKN